MRLSLRTLQNIRLLARTIDRDRHTHVLMHFSEYLAPIWAPRLRRLKQKHVTFGSVLHDPVRDYVVGPRFWHEWSIRQAYSFLDVVYVHSDQQPVEWTDSKLVCIPYGIHTFPKATQDRRFVRKDLNLPDDAKVLLAAGYIRDNKNLDLVIRAIAKIPELYLIVAGTEPGGGNKAAVYYQKLATELACADRCRWLIGFADAVDRANLFVAADICVLTYSSSFRSASSAMSASVNYRRPSIVSSGPGSMEAVIKQYGIGMWVEPDSAPAIMNGLQRWLASGIHPDWDAYIRDNSWTENARRVIESMVELRSARESRSLLVSSARP